MIAFGVATLVEVRIVNVAPAVFVKERMKLPLLIAKSGMSLMGNGTSTVWIAGALVTLPNAFVTTTK